MPRAPSDDEIAKLIAGYAQLTNKAASLDCNGSYAALIVNGIPTLTVWAADPFRQLQLFVREAIAASIVRKQERKAALARLLASDGAKRSPRGAGPRILRKDAPLHYVRHVPSRADNGMQASVRIHPDLTVRVESPNGYVIGFARWKRAGVVWSDEASEALPSTARTMIASDMESLAELFLSGLLDVRAWTSEQSACAELGSRKRRRPSRSSRRR